MAKKFERKEKDKPLTDIGKQPKSKPKDTSLDSQKSTIREKRDKK